MATASPTALDEYPVHQLPLPMSRVDSGDRNFYDRCYLNAHDRTGRVFLVTGLGVYPNLGVIDAYAAVRLGDRQHVVRFSDALEERSTEQRVGGYEIDVVEPLRELRVNCTSPDDSIEFDLTYTAAFPAVQEEPHLLFDGNRPTLNASRFAQAGSWRGELTVAGEKFPVDNDVWTGTRDRSWGIRPVGEPDPPGRSGDEPREGFWWLYMPLRFPDYQLLVILQENPDGYRTLNNAKRVWPDGRVEQLGWPRVEIDYRRGGRHPERARVHLSTADGTPLTVEVDTLTSVPMHIGLGYGGDSDWSHGRWMGRDYRSTSSYDLTDEAIAERVRFGVVDHLARATCEGEQGWGMFEHGTLGRHDPTGFADYSSVA